MTREQPGGSPTERVSADVSPDDAELSALEQEVTDDFSQELTAGGAASDGGHAGGAERQTAGGDTSDTSDGDTANTSGAAEADAPVGAKQEAFSLLKAFGGWGALLDAGLPGVAFVVAYTVFDQNLRLALLVAVALGGLFAVIRLWRKDPLQNVIGGFVAVAVAAAIANATGQAEDFYLSGLIINLVYMVGWTVANLLRYPVMGLVIGLAAGWGFEWRKDRKLMRAFTLASWVWVVFFAVRLAVQVPMYFNESLGQIAVARLLMGWPLWLVVLVTSYFVIKATVPPESWASVRQAAAQWADGQRPGVGQLARGEKDADDEQDEKGADGEQEAAGNERA